MSINHLCKRKISATQFSVAKASDNADDIEAGQNQFICIEKNISRKPIMALFSHYTLYPFALDNQGGNALVSVIFGNIFGNRPASLRFTEQAVSIHRLHLIPSDPCLLAIASPSRMIRFCKRIVYPCPCKTMPPAFHALPVRSVAVPAGY